MAPTKTKFPLLRIVVRAAVFISLCVPTMSAEVRRCYWCGPLAEQVHRSQRALPCSDRHAQVTVCDPGFPYCAVVATSPPYMESRYCVKLYQDECYTLYCNSTRTWRMTCPCRGDLCNGPNTEHEEEAFAGLSKLVARTQNTRIRRALINTSGFISMNTNRRNRIDNTTVEETKNISNNILDNNEGDVKNNATQVNNDANSEDVDAKSADQNDTTASIVTDVNNGEQASELYLTDEVVKNTESQMNITSIQIDIPATNVESSDLKTEIILMSSESTKLLNDSKLSIVTNMNENVPDIPTTPEMVTQTETEIKPVVEMTTEATKTAPAVVKMNENKGKPSEQLPTAEALQHNDTPTAKTTELPNISTTVTTFTSTQHIDLTTQASKPRNNTAVRIDAHILTFTFVVIIHRV